MLVRTNHSDFDGDGLMQINAGRGERRKIQRHAQLRRLTPEYRRCDTFTFTWRLRSSRRCRSESRQRLPASGAALFSQRPIALAVMPSIDSMRVPSRSRLRSANCIGATRSRRSHRPLRRGFIPVTPLCRRFNSIQIRSMTFSHS